MLLVVPDEIWLTEPEDAEIEGVSKEALELEPPKNPLTALMAALTAFTIAIIRS